MAVTPFRRKVCDLRYSYGDLAAKYFEAHPLCASCGEDRIAALTLHHVRGKAVDEFETLCFNCHMLHHSASPEVTYADELLRLRRMEEDAASRERRDAQVRALREEGKTLREIAQAVGISHVSVWRIIGG